jgi:hypothetical protein
MITGERVVIQGNAKGVKPSIGALIELFKDAGKRGPWRPVRHYHGVGPGGVTKPKYRYPSGIGGDMAGVRTAALAEGHMWIEVLDIVTENGREKVYFGYDPETMQYFVGRPTKGGPGAFEYFNKLDEYHEWVERETGERLNVLGSRDDAMDPAGRKVEDPPDKSKPANVDDGWEMPLGHDVTGEWDSVDTVVDKRPQLPDVPPRYKAQELAKRFDAASLREALIDRLTALEHSMSPDKLPGTFKQVLKSLLAFDGKVNAKVAELAPIVMEGLRTPRLYVEVIVEAWELMMADPKAHPDINSALIQLAADGGHRVKGIPKQYGTLYNDFFGDWASRADLMVDFPLLGPMHGALSHLIQDLVVNKAFAAAGLAHTSPEFRQMLGECKGYIYSTTGEPITGAAGRYDTKIGEFVWQETYDATEGEMLNRPESIYPVLRELLGLW